MAWNDKLVSVIILTYNCIDDLPRALESVFMQDYPRIEIIISDDASDEFDEEAIREFINDYKTPNIERVQIIRSEVNTGTVLNVRRAIDAMTGDFYVTFGSDDVFYGPTVISEYIYTFYLRGWKPLLVSGRAAMYADSEFKRYRTSIPTRLDIRILLRENPRHTLNALASRCVVATVATCYRRDFPEKVDAYDTIYKYYEDYPSFLRMARKGYTPVFIDRIMIKHAAGGIANGTTKVNKEAATQFYKDRNTMWETEFEPYKDMFWQQSIEANVKRRQLELEIYKRSISDNPIKNVFKKVASVIDIYCKKGSLYVSHYLAIAAICGIFAIMVELSGRPDSALTSILINVPIALGIFLLVSSIVFSFYKLDRINKRSRSKRRAKKRAKLQAKAKKRAEKENKRKLKERGKK